MLTYGLLKLRVGSSSSMDPARKGSRLTFCSSSGQAPDIWRGLCCCALLFMTGCVHRVQPHFSERKCAAGTELWDVAYQGEMTQVCVVLDPKTNHPLQSLPVVMPGVDPSDTDGDEGVENDKPHKDWWQFWKKTKRKEGTT